MTNDVMNVTRSARHHYESGISEDEPRWGELDRATKDFLIAQEEGRLSDAGSSPASGFWDSPYRLGGMSQIGW